MYELVVLDTDINVSLLLPDFYLEEVELDIPVLFTKEAHPSFLFVHALLHYSSTDDVYP